MYIISIIGLTLSTLKILRFYKLNQVFILFHFSLINDYSLFPDFADAPCLAVYIGT